MKEAYYKNLYYRVNTWGTGRPTLVFMHGLSGSSSAWLPYEKTFEEKYNILSFDIRGHGKSQKFNKYHDYEIANFSSDLHELTEYLHIEKFILISHSFATLIAAEYIKSYQGKVAANVFLSPIFYLEKGLMAKLSRPILALTRIFDFFPFYLKPGGHVDYTKYPNSTDWSLARCFADVTNTTLPVYLFCLRKSVTLNQEYSLEKIDIPTLIVHGRLDSMAPVQNSIDLSKKIKNSKLIIIENTDHIVVLNNVKDVSQAIMEFVEASNKYS